ncbi:MAG: hypothetical protein ABSG94_10720 [Brevinematales bacterium]|jgi:hypothetical protein
MKRLSITAVFIFITFLSAYSAGSGSLTGAGSSVLPANPYTQLIGFKTGGEFYLNTFLSDWTSAVFFENVINQWFGFEIDLANSSIPITNYTQVTAVNPQTFYGTGKLQYFELSGAIKFYVQSVSVSLGITYNNFNSGYMVENTANQYITIGDEYNYFSVFCGPELTAQISSDLFTKVGIQAIYGILNTIPNYSVGVRFYISFAYGI